MEDPSGIMANTKNPNAAKLFMEFLLSVEKSQIAVDAASETMRPEVELPPDQPRIGEVKTFRIPLEEVVTGVPEEIGRASCRERVCQEVEIWVVDVSLKKKKKKQE